MKRSLMFFGLAAAALLSAAVPAIHAQEEGATPSIHLYTKTIPLDGAGVKAAHQAANTSAGAAVAGAAVASATLPMWNYTIVAPKDGNTYPGTMVGANPGFNGARTTNIPTVVVPVVIVLSNGSVYNPTASDTCSPFSSSALNLLMNSPIFLSSSYTINGINMGSGQYIDEFQRANFYDTNVEITGNSYHTVLNPVSTAASVTFQVPAGLGASWFMGGCKNLAVVDYTTFNNFVTSLLPNLASQGVNPASLPVFLLHDVVMATGDSPFGNCCVVGYHGAVASGSSIQTYAEADYDTSGGIGIPDIQAFSTAIGEWMDNPYGTNATPPWGGTGSVGVGACDTTLDVGSPLTEWGFPSVLMPNGVYYNPQQLAFYSWFFGQIPSIGAGGGYADGVAFTVPAHNCST